MASLQLIIFDFDGTLFDTHRAIGHSLESTFRCLLPSFMPPQAQINALIGSGKGLKDVITALHPNTGDFDEQEWISTYRRFYGEDGQQLITPFPGVQELLESLSTRKIPIAVVSNKSVAAVEMTLKQYGLLGMVDFIIGDTTPGATRKPDGGSYFNVLLPAMESRGIGGAVKASNVIVVGDTEADIKFAGSIGGAKSVWCKYGFGDEASCKSCRPDYTIDSVGELTEILQADFNV